ncbi:hypothetical protein EV421DRAFT_1741787 [Armillaria borealis]|uniref:Uncharacterized protein n=1 Tax=Armillaria borealis TaxID=47425 RepID=A0AA39J2E7_9AGAR|nr:hypothetical protein EV421DRAFT_1741787 [Armillaria borealis]
MYVGWHRFEHEIEQSIKRQPAGTEVHAICIVHVPIFVRVSSTLAALELVLITHEWATAVKKIWREVSIPIICFYPPTAALRTIFPWFWPNARFPSGSRTRLYLGAAAPSERMRVRSPRACEEKIRLEIQLLTKDHTPNINVLTGIWTSVSLGRDAKKLLDTSLWVVVSLRVSSAERAAVLWSKIAKRHRHQISIMLWVGVEHTHACVKQSRCVIRAQGVGRRRSRDVPQASCPGFGAFIVERDLNVCTSRSLAFHFMKQALGKKTCPLNRLPLWLFFVRSTVTSRVADDWSNSSHKLIPTSEATRKSRSKVSAVVILMPFCRP